MVFGYDSLQDVGVHGRGNYLILLIEGLWALSVIRYINETAMWLWLKLFLIISFQLNGLIAFEK